MESTLGKRIIINRKRLGFTQDQLAEQLGITAQAVSKWENDLSCPDISIIPRLADIFGITTDELLGREVPAEKSAADVGSEDTDNTSRFIYDSDTGKMDFHLNGIKAEGISLAVWVILTVQLLHLEVSFWNILWPAFFFVFGILGLYPKFSVLRFGCMLLGTYFLLEKLQIIAAVLNSGIIIAAVIVLFGISLLVEVLRKSKRPLHFTDQHNHKYHGKMVRDFTIDDGSFSYDASFGSDSPFIQLDKLRHGNISVNFGEYTVDLTGIADVEAHCRIHADCSFGELTILVPRRYAIIADSSTSFASLDILGQPDNPNAGTISLDADASFGSIRIQYV